LEAALPRTIDRTPDGHPLDHAYEQDAIASLVRIATVFGSERFQRGFDPHRVIPEDANAIPAIYAIATRGPQRPSTLAGDLHVSAPTVSRLLEKLAAAGLVGRLPDPTDSRATLAHLTRSGHAVADGMFTAGDRLIADLLADWSDTDRGALDVLLHRLADALVHFAAPTIAPQPEE
jgi:DNA-binding MarR family transcriptional regulator